MTDTSEDRQQLAKERILAGWDWTVSDLDLIAVLLRNACPGRSSLTVAERLLRSCGGLWNLSSLTRDRAKAFHLSDRSTAVLLAAVELKRRWQSWCARHNRERSIVILARHLAELFSPDHREVLGAVYLNPRKKVLGSAQIFRGRLAASSVDLKPMLREALYLGASGVLLAHCYPSQDADHPQGSAGLVDPVREACEALGLELVDFQVIGHRFMSYRDTRPW